MKRRTVIRLLIGAGVALFLSFSCVGYGAYRTFGHRGEQALAVMSEEELSIAEKLQAVTRETTYPELVELLGPPSRPAGGLRPSWQGPGVPWSQYYVYFSPASGTVMKIRWLKLGSFFWEIEPER